MAMASFRGRAVDTISVRHRMHDVQCQCALGPIDGVDECSTCCTCGCSPRWPVRGSVTGAAKELRYTQPSVSHHLARLETETGTKLIQRVGRGIRLTPEGDLLAQRAVEIIGRVDAAAAELAAHVGLNEGRVRLAGFQSALSTIVPAAATALAHTHPGIELSLFDVHPVEALRMLRAGRVDVAIVFRYADTPAEEDGVRLTHLVDDPTYLVSQRAWRHDRRPSRRHLDRRLRTVHGGAGRRLSAERRLHPSHRLLQRRHGRHAITRRRRHGRDHPSRAGPPGPPFARHPHHRAARPPPPDLLATYGDPPTLPRPQR